MTKHISPLEGIDGEYLIDIEKDTMAPYIQAGDRLICSHAAAAIDGQVVIALINGEMTCRRYRTDPPRFEADNATVETETEATIEGIVNGIVRRVA